MVFVAVLLTVVEFERRYAVVDGLVVLPSRSVMDRNPYSDPRAVAPVLRPLLKYGPPSCTLDVFVVCGTVVVASESVVVCGMVVMDNGVVVVELWYDAGTVDELPKDTVRPQATPKK